MWRLSTVRSGVPAMAVGSVSRSLAATGSLAVVAVAALVTDGNAAGATAAVSVNRVESPAARLAANVAVTIAPEVAKDQPAPAAPTNPRPAGSVSRTVVAPEVAAPPRLRTTSV